MTGLYLKVFVDSLEKYQKLNDAEYGRLMRAALRYKAAGDEVRLPGREELLWDGIKLEIDRDNQKYAEVAEKRAEAGKKGADIRWQTDSKNGKSHLPYGKNGQDKDKDKDKDKDYVYITQKKFIPPTLDEVRSYCLNERHNTVDAKRFFDYFDASGWIDSEGKQVKNWKQKVITWETNGRKSKPEQSSNPFLELLREEQLG